MYRSDAVSAEGVHHVLGVFVPEEYFGHVDAEEILVALVERYFNGVAQTVTETLTLSAQLGHVQKNGVCNRPTITIYDDAIRIKSGKRQH